MGFIRIQVYKFVHWVQIILSGYGEWLLHRGELFGGGFILLWDPEQWLYLTCGWVGQVEKLVKVNIWSV